MGINIPMQFRHLIAGNGMPATKDARAAINNRPPPLHGAIGTYAASRQTRMPIKVLEPLAVSWRQSSPYRANLLIIPNSSRAHPLTVLVLPTRQAAKLRK